MYRKIGFKRWWMMLGFGFFTITTYTMYVTNKRKPLIRSFAVSKVKDIILGHTEIKNLLGGRVMFVDTTMGALIDKQADYELAFYGYNHSGKVTVSSFYDDEKSDFVLKDVTAQLFDRQGAPMKGFEIMKNRVNLTNYNFDL
jgi:hypothetical protein